MFINKQLKHLTCYKFVINLVYLFIRNGGISSLLRVPDKLMWEIMLTLQNQKEAEV